ncbi:MAG: type II toxin-antitoxin system Phd/YefM family antitoxin [Acidimicrobiales bacterium]
MQRSLTVSEARARLPEVIERVLSGEEVVLTRHGQPVAVVVRPEALRLRKADGAFGEAAAVRELLDRAGDGPLSERPGLDADRAEELLAEVRKSRAAG